MRISAYVLVLILKEPSVTYEWRGRNGMSGSCISGSNHTWMVRATCSSEMTFLALVCSCAGVKEVAWVIVSPDSVSHSMRLRDISFKCGFHVGGMLIVVIGVLVWQVIGSRRRRAFMAYSGW